MEDMATWNSTVSLENEYVPLSPGSDKIFM
jgi:hypothetical protein